MPDLNVQGGCDDAEREAVLIFSPFLSLIRTLMLPKPEWLVDTGLDGLSSCPCLLLRVAHDCHLCPALPLLPFLPVVTREEDTRIRCHTYSFY